MRKKQKHRSKVNFGKDFEVIVWPVRRVFGPGGRTGLVCLEVENLFKKKSREYTRVGLPDLGFGVVGPLNYPKRRRQSPKAKGPRAKAKSPKSKGTIERGTDHAHGLGSPVADIYIHIYIYICIYINVDNV